MHKSDEIIKYNHISNDREINIIKTWILAISNDDKSRFDFVIVTNWMNGKVNYFAGAGLIHLLLFVDSFFDGIQLLNAFICNFINVIDIGIFIGTTFASHFCIVSNFYRTRYYAQCNERYDKQCGRYAKAKHKLTPRFIQIETCKNFCRISLQLLQNSKSESMTCIWIHFYKIWHLYLDVDVVDGYDARTILITFRSSRNCLKRYVYFIVLYIYTYRIVKAWITWLSRIIKTIATVWVQKIHALIFQRIHASIQIDKQLAGIIYS